jgi:hypothetical protein
LTNRFWLERLTDNAEVATVLGSISASSDSVESEGRQFKQCDTRSTRRVGFSQRYGAAILVLDPIRIIQANNCVLE